MKTAPPSAQELASAQLAMLTSQTEAVRAELSRLRHDLAILHREEHACHAEGLQTANEKLLVAALDASTVAERATLSLAGLIASAQRDVLTDTPNRAVTLERLDQAIGRARRHNTLMAVLFVDLDHLKAINDSLGHAAGDAVLQLAARRLESVVRTSDTVSRHGGDEFVVLLCELSQPGEAAEIAGKMLEAFAVPAHMGGHVLSLTASIGISVFPLDACTGPELIEIADNAMYQIKRRGGGSHGFAQPCQGILDRPTTALRIGLGPVDSGQANLAKLKQVNEQLVITAIAAHEVKDQAEDRRRNEMKFMAMVAHELRTPLTPIRLAADMLSLAGADKNKIKKLQGIIGDEVQHLVYLVEDLLDASRINTGKLRMELDLVDINAVLAQAVDANLPHILARSQTIDARQCAEPIVLLGNKSRLRQVFSNLLDNASKYTPEGGRIEVNISTDVGRVVVVIADNGIGIPAHALPHIFDLFVQEAGALSLHNGGLGIGLALVHELVHAHGGTVSAQSGGRNQGSRFVITLPALATPR